VVAIALPAGAAARIRIAVSCLWEVAASVRVLRNPGNHAVHLPWVTKVRPQVTDGLLWQLIQPAPAYFPDFLTPAPGGLVPDLDAELAVLRATPAAAVRADLDRYAGRHSPAVAELYADPDAGLDRLVAEIREYWRTALAPEWPRIRLLLDAEVFQRSRRVAADGAAALLNDLHEHVRWAGETLSVAQRHCTVGDVPAGGGLVLVPSVFAWPDVLSLAAGDTSQLAYPPRGIAKLWESAQEASSDVLGAVLGHGRARLLVALRAPLSTTELAGRTGMTIGGVSQHLATLRAAGLVVAQRHGRTVLNARTTVAEALLSAAT
jgi:hypothetical protein